VASEWSNGEVYSSGSTLEKKKTNLRKKISKHKNSAAHLNAQKVIFLSEKKVIDEHISMLMVTDQENTARIFRTAYLIAKNQRPYTDMPKLTDLQELNGLDMGRILQTNVSCSNIIDHLALEMRRKIAMDIVKNNRKICILVDESTTLSKKSMLVICLRCAVGELNEVYTFLFDIVEVSNTSAKTIKDSILQVLEKYGMDTHFLKKNLISFVSDGASNMLGRKAGVGVLLQKSFPHIILWHCCNHRLELAVADCLKEVSGINHFQSFIEKLYSLYHMSPKNMNELKECANSIDQQLLKIGKIFTIRWVASSLRTIKAVWNNFESLFQHFSNAIMDDQRSSKEKAKYVGLKNTLKSIEFVHNLGILFDALTELSDLSIQLQKRDLSLMAAHKLIERTISVLESMANKNGEKTKEVNSACEQKEFKGIILEHKYSVVKIEIGQFFRSLSDNLKQRLFTTQSSHVSILDKADPYKDLFNNLLIDLTMLSPDNWPDNCDVQFGDINVSRLSKIFQIDQRASVRGFREYKVSYPSVNTDIEPLMTAVKTLAISSAECERSFSSMNEIVSSKRSVLTSDHISSLAFINCTGPPINKFNPNIYIKTWILSGKRTADEQCCPKRKKKDEEESYTSLWLCLDK